MSRVALPALLLALAGCAVSYPGSRDCFPCPDGGAFCDQNGAVRPLCLTALAGGGTSGSSMASGGTTNGGRGASSGGSTSGKGTATGASTSGSAGTTGSSPSTGASGTTGGSNGGSTSSGSSSGTSGTGTSGGTTPSPSDAPAFGIDAAHDGAQPNDAVASPLTLAWSSDLSALVSYPIVGGGTVFVAAGGALPEIRAYDLATGQSLWNRGVGASVWLAYDQGELFGLTGAGNLTAWDVAKNTVLWSTQFNQSSYSSPPVAVGGLVYVNGLGSAGTTYAVNEADGGLVWSMKTFDGSSGTVAVAAGVVYEAEEIQRLNAFDAATGTVNWSYDGMMGSGGGGLAPAVYQGDIYARDSSGNYIVSAAEALLGSFSSSLLPAFHAGTGFYLSISFGVPGVLEAVDIATGSVAWTFTADPGLCTAAVVAGDGGQVFVGSSLGGVYELDEATGVVRSVADAGSPVTCGSETQAMAIAGGHLLVPAGNSLFVY